MTADCCTDHLLSYGTHDTGSTGCNFYAPSLAELSRVHLQCRQDVHEAYLRGLSEGLGRMASVVDEAVSRLSEWKPR